MSTAFFTDKYELTMLQAILESGKAFEKATFELFARRLPNGRRYGVVGGTNRAIEAVKNFYFTEDQLTALKKDPAFSDETIEYLKNYTFSGTIKGYREGDFYFPNSPILTVEGFLADAILLETLLLSVLNHDSAVMSAGARMVAAAKNVPLMEMGSRRTHEEAAVAAARAAYVVGFGATSNMEAGIRYGVPTAGTAAHAFTLAFDTEKEAFEAQVKSLGKGTTLLVDTYDIEQGVRNAVAAAGTDLGAIRIDSGDLHEETVNARELLDELGATKTKIVLSSDMDEYTLSELNDRGTPLDSAGVGTRLVTGSGAPTAEMVFKLVEREDKDGNMIPVVKNSSGKKSAGGLKIAFRTHNDDGVMDGEFYVLDNDARAAVDELTNNKTFPLQVTYIDKGEYFVETTEEVRKFHATVKETLPTKARRIDAGDAAFIAEHKNFTKGDGNNE